MTKTKRLCFFCIFVMCIYYIFTPKPQWNSNYPENTFLQEKHIVLTVEEVLTGISGYIDKSNKLLSKYIKDVLLHQPSPRDQPYNFTPGKSMHSKSEYGQDVEIDKILQGKTNGFFIECGASNGESFSNSLFFEMNRNWSGILIEANPIDFKDLMTKRRKAFALESCLSVHPFAEKLTYLGFEGFIGGLEKVKPSDKLQEYRNRQSNLKRDTVQCFPLYPILLSLGNPTVDLFSLDVEGAEEGVLENIPWDKVDIKVVLVEIEHSNAKAINETMAKNGYEMRLNIKKMDYIFVKKGI